MINKYRQVTKDKINAFVAWLKKQWINLKKRRISFESWALWSSKYFIKHSLGRHRSCTKLTLYFFVCFSPSRNKRLETSKNSLVITQQNVSLAVEAVKANKLTAISPRSFKMVSESKRSQTAKSLPEVVDLEDEKKGPSVVAARVQVNRRHSLTPVTQGMLHL